MDVTGCRPTFGELAYAVIRRHLHAMLAREPGTRLGEDAEELHEMRVAPRRLRAALAFFSAALPTDVGESGGGGELLDELRWVAGRLGEVRDLDVQLDRLVRMSVRPGGPGARDESSDTAEDGPALVQLAGALQATRDEARARLLEALDSRRWERLVTALVAMDREGPSEKLEGSRADAAVAAGPLVVVRHRAVVKAAQRARRTGLASDHHRLRIRAKRLRYSLEFAGTLYGPPAARYGKTLARLHVALGAIQDAEVASARLRSIALTTSAGLSPATVFAMGRIAERYDQESTALRNSIGPTLDLLDSRDWKRLAAALGAEAGAGTQARAVEGAEPSS